MAAPQQESPRLVVVGSCNVDLISYMPRLPHTGETVFGTSFSKGFGGKGANQCVMAGKLAQRAGAVAMVSAVGDDGFGVEYLAELRSLAIDPSNVRIVARTATGVAPIWVNEATGDNSIVVIPGANAHIQAEWILSPPVAPLLRGAAVVLCQLEIASSATLAALQTARGGSAVTVLTPAPAPPGGLPAAFYEATDILVPNRTEALLLAASLPPAPGESAAPTEGADGSVAGGDESAVPMARVLAAARRLLAAGAAAVVVTCGSKGCIVAVRGPGGDAAAALDAAVAGAVFVHAVRARAVDTTGAGDAFCGSMAHFYAQLRRAGGKEREPVDAAALLQACRRAAVVAADSVTKPGTQKSYASRAELPAALFAAEAGEAEALLPATEPAAAVPFV